MKSNHAYDIRLNDLSHLKRLGGCMPVVLKKKGAQTGSQCNEFSQLTYVYYVQLYNAPIQQDKSWWSLEV